MRSFAFPNMFEKTHANIIKDHDATLSNLKLLLRSCVDTLFGDPEFGTKIERLLFEQNDIVLKDIIIDNIFSAIIKFMPQLIVERKNIKVIQDRTQLVLTIKALNLIDYQTDLFSLNLLGGNNQQ